MQKPALHTCLFLLLLIPFTGNSQHVEVGITLGASNYFGDLAPTPVLSEIHPAGGLFARYNISSSFALTGAFNTTMISGSDKNFPENNARNLSFRSMIYEYSALVEFNFLKYGVGVLDKNFTSYVFLGASVLNFNPQAEFNGQWIDLRGIQTEGVSYSTYTYAVPFGIGVKYRLNKNFALEANFGFRKTFTDRLDDVSGKYPNIVTQLEKKGYLAAVLTDRSAELNGGNFQNKEGYRRGNADFDDWYMMGGVSLTYRIYSRIKCARFY